MPILGSLASQNTKSFLFAPSGAYDSIATTTLSSTNDIVFSSIPATYTHLQIRYMVRCSVGAQSEIGYSRFNSDITSNYSSHYFQYDIAAGTTTSGSFNSSYMPIADCIGSSATANYWAIGIIDILDYANTNKYKTVRSTTGWATNSNSLGQASLRSGNWRSNTAINDISFGGLSGGFIAGSTAGLYGIKGA